MLEKITDDIVRIKVPFADIYTTVCIVNAPCGVVLFDTATTARDVDGYIAPAFEKLNLKPDYVFISHNHGDHSGGLPRVMELYPQAQVITENPQLQEQYGCHQLPEGVLQLIYIPGHTPDAIGLLDTRTGTLISGDCLQAYGIYGRGPWGSAIRHIGPHFQALEELGEMKLNTIITAHDYHPFASIVNKEQIPALLDTCREALEKVRQIVAAQPESDDLKLAEICNTRGLPRIDHRVIAGIRIAMETGVL